MDDRERGRIDLLAFFPACRILLVVEVKTSLVDVQELLGRLDVKARVAHTLVGGLGWERPASVVPAIVLADSSTARRHLAHVSPLLRRYDLRGRAATAWMTHPMLGPTGLLVLRALPSVNGVDRRRAGRRRVRRIGAG